MTEVMDRFPRDRADALLDAAERSATGDDLRSVAALLSAAADVGPSEPPAGLVEAMAVEARSFSHAAPTRRKRAVLASVVTAKAAAVSATVALTATAAAAAAGSLPDIAQDGLAKAASHIGVDLPDSADDDAVDATTDLGPHVHDHEHGPLTAWNGIGGEQGAVIVAITQADHASGRDNGAAVSEAAGDGHGRDERPAPTDDPHRGATHDGDPAAEDAPAETPPQPSGPDHPTAEPTDPRPEHDPPAVEPTPPEAPDPETPEPRSPDASPSGSPQPARVEPGSAAPEATPMNEHADDRPGRPS